MALGGELILAKLDVFGVPDDDSNPVRVDPVRIAPVRTRLPIGAMRNGLPREPCSSRLHDRLPGMFRKRDGRS